MVATSHFTNWKLDTRRSYQPGVPKAHYELEYLSQINRNANYILLDILFEKVYYPAVKERPIQTIWIETENIIHVTLPTAEAITGDKLTAFAPTTTGILYGKGKGLEIIKQLFDLSHLFDKIQVMDVVAASFEAFVRRELAYRGLRIDAQEVLWDSIRACRVISFKEGNKIEPARSHFEELQKGIRSLDNYLITGNFRIDEAVTASAKVAYLSAKLLREEFSPVKKYVGQGIHEMEIMHPDWNGLNRLKRFPDQSAFFYWYQCLSLLGLADVA